MPAGSKRANINQHPEFAEQLRRRIEPGRNAGAAPVFFTQPRAAGRGQGAASPPEVRGFPAGGGGD